MRKIAATLSATVLISGLFIPFPTITSARAALAGSGACQQEFTKDANGGDVTVVELNGYCYVAFRNTGSLGTSRTFTWNVPASVTSADLLIIAGGGGGGTRHAPGGGAGGLLDLSATTVPAAGQLTIVVGAGGSGAANSAWSGSGYPTGSRGQNSSVVGSGISFIAQGGGGGDTASVKSSFQNGGSGSGGSCCFDNRGTGENGQGHGGGLGATSGSVMWLGGGGGGAGGSGGAASTSSKAGGNGGAGSIVNWIPTSAATTLGVGDQNSGSVYFAGGGAGGAGGTGTSGGTGGLGGGGNGGSPTNVTMRSNATDYDARAHTGGGGGGSGIQTDGSDNGGDGGSGVVVIRFIKAGLLDLNSKISTSGPSNWIDQTTGNNISTTSGQNFPTWISTNKYFSFGSGNQIFKNVSYTNPSTFSIEIWFRTTQSGSKILGFQNAAGAGTTATSYDRHLYVDTDGKLRFGMYNNSQTQTLVSDSAVNDGNWHHAVATFTGTTAELYVDNVRKTSTMAGSTQIYAGVWVIGGGKLDSWPSAGTNGPAFQGDIGLARVYGAVLSTAQVANAFSYIKGQQTVTLTLNSNFDTPTTQTQQLDFGTSTAIQSNSFTRNGHVFSSWSANSDGTGTTYSAGQSISLTGDRTIFAKWIANTYTITYDSNGGSSASNGTFTVGGSGLTLPTVTRTGFTFAGWYEASDFSGSQLTSPYSPTQTRTVYAKWTANTYNVTYDEKGGSTVTDGTFITGGSVSFPTSPTRAGYIFAGWSATDGGSVVSIPYSPGLTNNITLYAVWTAQTHSITWDSNGGSNVSSPSTFETGGSISKPNDPTRSGKVFLGWSTTESNDQGVIGNQILSWPHSPVATQAISLYAIWVDPLIAYESFQGTNGTNLTGSSSTGSSGFSGTWLLVNAVKQGNAAAITHQYRSMPSLRLPTNSSLSIPASNTGAQGLQWSLYYNARALNTSINFDSDNTYYLSFINHVPTPMNGWHGTAMLGLLTGLPTSSTDTGPKSIFFGSAYTGKFGIDYGFANQALWVSGQTIGTKDANADYSVIGSKVSAPTTEANANFVVVKITTSSSGNDQIQLKAFAPNETLPNSDSSISSWDVTYSNAITGQAGHLAVQSEYYGVIDEARVGYTYSSVTGAESIYTITYDSNGGSSASNGTFTVGGSGLTLPTVTRTGYIFAGWYEASDFSGSALSGAYSPTQTRTVYAKWTANTYNVTYDEKGGSTVTDGTFITGGSVIFPSAPIRAGFIFGGWSATDGGSAVSSPYSPGVTSNITLYAVWITIAPPTNVQATAGNQTVTVSWLPPSTALSQPPTAYRVEYSTTGTGSWTTADATLASTVRSLEITGLSNGTNYYVRVAAVYSGVNGVYGYPWTLIFESTTPARQSTAMVYTNTNGLTGNDVDLSRTDFSRVRYYVGAKYASGDATRLFVDANFDKSMTNLGSNSETYANGNLHRLQVPTTAGGTQSQFELHGNISNLDVTSNSSAVTQGTGLSGRLEIWPWNYGPTPQTGLSGGSLNTGTYDDGDSWVAGGTYGSFQLHNIGTGAQTVFAWNNHGATPEIGFGNNVSNSNPDWTFASREGGYTQRADFLFQSYANLSVTPTGNYTISYNANSASSGNVPSNQTKIQGTNLALASNSGNLARTGYTYAGWNTQADGSGTSFAAGATYTLDEGDELFAKWTANQYAFNGNTASGSTSSLTFAGSTLIAPSNGFTVPTGFTFGGWCSAALASAAAACSGTTYLAGANLPTPASATVTLYAIWVASTFTITYEYNGADGGTRPATNNFTTGGTAITLPTPTKTGYTFAGWFAEVGLATSVGLAGANYSPTSTTTIYAKWTANSNTVTFKSNFVGGANDATQSIVSGTATNLTSNSFTRTGYTFAGWNTLADGTGTNYTNGESVTLTGALTLFAKWTVATYTITYNYNSATGGNSVASGTFTTGGSNLVLPVPTRTGYTFAGWFDDSGFAGSALGSSISTTSSKTIYAKWDAATFTVLYDYNSATGGNTTASNTFTTGSTAITPPTPTRTGYTFAGWFESSSFTGSAVSSSYTTTQNRTLYAKWNAIPYTLTYSADIVVSGSTVSPDSGTAPQDSSQYTIGQSATLQTNSGGLTRSGYVFGGWVTNQDGSGSALLPGASITFEAADITLYPKWNPGTYTITYNKNGASGDLAKATDPYQTLAAGLTLPGAGTMTKSGYTFAGWSPSSSGQAVANSNFTTTSNVTLYAVWELTDFTISYNLNSPTTGSNPTSQTANIEQTVTISGSGGATKTGHWFSGWNTAADGSGSSFGAGQVVRMPLGGATLYAIWVPDQYRISYNANGGTGGPNLVGGFDEATFNVDYSLRPKGNLARAGYTFSHWTTNVAGTGTKYDENGDGVTELTTFTPTTNTTFYAQWTANVYSFSFNPDGGNNSPATQNKTIVQTISMPSAGTKQGYSFRGWTDGSIVYPQGSTYVVGSASRSFTALWTPDVYTIVFDWQGASGTPTPDASYTVGTGSLTLPVLGDRTRDGFTFGGWSETAGGTTAVSNFAPSGNDVLYAIWNDGNYTLSYNGQGASAGSGSGSVARGQSVNLPTPVRTGFVFNGWYDAETGGNKIGNGGQAHTPNRSKTMHARWVQKSLWGVDLATLESGSEYTASNSTEVDVTLTHVPTNTGARVKVPAGALPNGTKVNVQYFRDTNRQSALIPGENSYFFSVLVSWLSGTGSSATVPNTNAGKPIEVTLTNTAIKAGAMAYMVIGDQVTELGRATQDGTITVQLTEDPEIVVAATAPANPGSVVASGGNQQATISWSAPSTNGGAQITGYTVTANPGGATCTTTTTSCSITGLTNGTAYTFEVVATNSVGSSSGASSSSVTPAVVTYTVTFNSNGGSNVSNGSFTSGGSVSEPTAPTRSGFTFDGWSTTQNNAATKVTFPYSPGVTNNITLYALWTQVQSSGGSGGSGGGGSSPTPTVTPRPTPGPTPSPAPTPTAPPSQIGFKPTPPATPVVETGPVGSVVGSSEQVRVVKDAPSEKIVATAGSWQLEIKPPVTEETTKPVTEKLELQFPVASRAQIAGTGLQPNTTVEAWVFSEPMYVGTIKVGQDGSFASNLTLPKNLLPGQHTLQIGSLNSQGRLVTLSVPITIKGSVTVGTFRGFVAIFTKDLQGQELTARVAGKWIRQNPIRNFKTNSYSRLVRFTGAGYDIVIDVYINKKFYKRYTTRTR